ncbi:fungal-specific transcription factor domain-containing protein [Biscogniauxia marginata]|nr:fungal-specific transcription factor domain-containing protein [Biscogniauxia marginata]
MKSHGLSNLAKIKRQPLMHHRGGNSGLIKKNNYRSRNGCLTCRARKIKCDENPIGCVNCERIDVICPGYEPGQMKRNEHYQLQSKTSSVVTEAGIKRSRILRSCNGCRQAKTKCSGDSPACLRCRNKNIQCMFEPSRLVKKGDGHDKQVAADQRRGLDGVPQEYCSGTNTLTDNCHWSDSGLTQDSSLSWLTSSVLPGQAKIRKLVDAYFVNVHPLRCLSFIHIPSFKHRLDFLDSNSSDSDRNALLYAVCAHGARFYAFDHGREQSSLGYVMSAGRGWASRAHNILLGGDLSIISVENLMAAVLLHDYQLRVGNYMHAFLVTGIAARMVQILKINTEPSPGIPETRIASMSDTRIRESKRRLAWSCFTMETGLTGIEQLDIFNESNNKLQLPCNERNFTLEIPCITEALHQGRRSSNAAENMGLVAYFVRLTWLRKKVMNFVKNIDLTKSAAVLAIELGAVNTLLQQWHSTLPATLHLNSYTICIRKESNQLAALFTMHLMYYSAICDLYSIGDRRLSYTSIRDGLPNRPSAEQLEFLTRCRKICVENAKRAAGILIKAVQHGPKVFSDTWMLLGTFGIIRILWCHITFPSEQGADVKRSMLEEISPLLRGVMEALRLMRSLFSMARRVFQAAVHLLMQAGLGPQLVQWMSIKDEPDSQIEHDGLPTANFNTFKTTESALHPLDIYNLAQARVYENPLRAFTLLTDFETIPPMRQTHSSPGSSAQHEDSQAGLIESADADNDNTLNSQDTPVADLDLTGFSFDTTALVQDD